VADALLEPTAIYARPIAELTRTVDVHGMAHITGGGIPGNLARQFPAGLGAEIDTGTWERQPVFGWLASLGVEAEEMWRVFNMGLGFACVVASESTDVALKALARGGTPGFVAGTVVEGEGVTLR
jgi:phosphoribosylformylglycinamidine cyclo-ligase